MKRRLKRAATKNGSLRRGLERPDTGLDLLSRIPDGHAKVIVRLEVQPDLRRDAEVASQSRRSIRRDRALAVDDLADPARRHVDVPASLLMLTPRILWAAAVAMVFRRPPWCVRGGISRERVANRHQLFDAGPSDISSAPLLRRFIHSNALWMTLVVLSRPLPSAECSGYSFVPMAG